MSLLRNLTAGSPNSLLGGRFKVFSLFPSPPGKLFGLPAHPLSTDSELVWCHVTPHNNRHWVIIAGLLISIGAASGQSLEIQESNNWDEMRSSLVEELRQLGEIKDERVLEAIGKVPRHLFVPPDRRRQAYENHALPIGEGQTISQPFVVAYMTQALNLTPESRVLEIGTGSGYHAAVMSSIAKEIFTIEIVPELGNSAAKLLKRLEYNNIDVRIGDGYRGWPEEAPFDAVILTAAPDEIPQPLIDQLAPGGRLIAPVGERFQRLVLLEKNAKGKITRKNLLPVVFVPMTGEAEK